MLLIYYNLPNNYNYTDSAGNNNNNDRLGIDNNNMHGIIILRLNHNKI